MPRQRCLKSRGEVGDDGKRSLPLSDVASIGRRPPQLDEHPNHAHDSAVSAQ